MRYNTYGIHERICDEECGELYHLIHKWPRATPKKCRYGVDTLDILLPDIVEKLRQEYMGALPAASRVTSVCSAAHLGHPQLLLHTSADNGHSMV